MDAAGQDDRGLYQDSRNARIEIPKVVWSFPSDNWEDDKMEEQSRGKLTGRIKALSMKLLGREIDQDELRLMPYLQYVMVNEQIIDHRKLKPVEETILSKWIDAGFLEEDFGSMKISKKFWDAVCEIVYLGYVDITVVNSGG